MKFYFVKLFYLIIVLFFVGCFGSVKNSNEFTHLDRINFVDIDAFDKHILDSMSLKTEKITVETSKYLTLSALKMPNRLNKLLSAIKGSGGNVEYKLIDNKSLGSALIATLTVAYWVWEQVENKRAYDAANAYDAKVFLFDDDSNIVHRIEFARKDG
ncbi:hypothetical protein QUF74_03630 [Candidatus Halobeggiatoa sp. HSG11]|nr:hypothetical protein [Candidatus Halobeggiatoa sp. HSG11]